jgi:hypothetical protein
MSDKMPKSSPFELHENQKYLMKISSLKMTWWRSFSHTFRHHHHHHHHHHHEHHHITYSHIMYPITNSSLVNINVFFITSPSYIYKTNYSFSLSLDFLTRSKKKSLRKEKKKNYYNFKTGRVQRSSLQMYVAIR